MFVAFFWSVSVRRDSAQPARLHVGTPNFGNNH